MASVIVVEVVDVAVQSIKASIRLPGLVQSAGSSAVQSRVLPCHKSKNCQIALSLFAEMT